jgi:cytochrome c6
MKKTILNVAIGLVTMVGFAFQAQAADIENGERIFTANCAACHAGGNNVIMPEKTLKKDALEANGMKSVGAITYQVTNGKNAMPAFGGRLSDSDIEDVANYVLSQSDKGWD